MFSVGSQSDGDFSFVRTTSNKSVIEGPSYDHYGDPYGYYIIAYGEWNSNDGATTTLKSPIFENIPEQCFHFHFSFNVSSQL